jgi:hypothetical protein
MVDEDVAYLSPSTVYRILADADLLARWKRSTRVGTAPPAPTRPHQRWHTDIMYLRVEDTWYFLVTVLDACHGTLKSGQAGTLQNRPLASAGQ